MILCYNIMQQNLQNEWRGSSIYRFAKHTIIKDCVVDQRIPPPTSGVAITKLSVNSIELQLITWTWRHFRWRSYFRRTWRFTTVTMVVWPRPPAPRVSSGPSSKKPSKFPKTRYTLECSRIQRSWFCAYITLCHVTLVSNIVIGPRLLSSIMQFKLLTYNY